MMLEDMNYSSISKVLESWELSRQKFGCPEEVGTMILLNLFDQAPETKTIFGFKKEDNIEANPMLRMGLLVHGARMVEMLDSVLDLLGPDTDLLVEVISGLGKRHQKLGVEKEHFELLGRAVRDALAEIMGDSWTDAIEDSWIEIFDTLTDLIVRGMDD
jgi:hemoglobin-like flavoprotein